jgi:hypothetical protein
MWERGREHSNAKSDRDILTKCSKLGNVRLEVNQ